MALYRKVARALGGERRARWQACWAGS